MIKEKVERYLYRPLCAFTACYRVNFPIPKKSKKNALKLPIVWFLVKHKSKIYTTYGLRRSIFETNIVTWSEISDFQTMSASYTQVQEVLRTVVWKQIWDPRKVVWIQLNNKKYLENLRSNSPNSSAISRELLCRSCTIAAVVAPTLDGVRTVLGRPPLKNTAAVFVETR
jgi:hypothetical protein